MFKYIVAGLGVVIVLMGAALAWQDGKLSKVEAALTVANGQLDLAKITIKGQKDALKECSDRTDALKAEGVKRQAAADQALLQAQQEAQRYQESNKRLGALLKAPTPSVAGAGAGTAGCSQALQELRKELRK